MLSDLHAQPFCWLTFSHWITNSANCGRASHTNEKQGTAVLFASQKPGCLQWFQTQLTKHMKFQIRGAEGFNRVYVPFITPRVVDKETNTPAFAFPCELFCSIRAVHGEACEHIVGGELPSLQDIYTRRCTRKARRIIKDSSHPSHRLLSLLPSGRRLHRIRSRTSRLRDSFFPQAIRLMNSQK